MSTSIGIKSHRFGGPVTLTFGPMTFIYEIDLYPLKLHPHTKYELFNFLAQGIWKLLYYRHTCTNIWHQITYMILLHGWEK